MSLKTSPVSTDKLINLNSVLEEKESRHGTDAQLSSNVRDFVDVYLEEFNTLNLARESLEVWRNQFAGTTPGCVAVNDDDLVLDGVLIILGVLDDMNHVDGCVMEVFGKSLGYGRVK